MTQSLNMSQSSAQYPGGNSSANNPLYNFRHYRLSFGDFELLDGCILTMRVDSGVEFDGRMAQQTLDLCARLLHQPGGLLIDHFHDYSYAFDALHLFADQARIPSIAAKAILVHNLRDHQSAKYLLAMGNDRQRSNVGIFNSRTETVAWLRDELRANAGTADRQRLGCRG